MKYTNATQVYISQFLEQHDVDEQSQFNVLVEEVGELAEALARDLDDDAVMEEVADVLFVAHTIGQLRGHNPYFELRDVARENSEKNAETEGAKITKTTSD